MLPVKPFRSSLGTLRRLSVFMMHLFASKRFFIVTILIFLIGSIWIAVSGRFPMAYDEGTHLGIIQIYSHQWSPFLSHQQVGADQFGPIVREPSYLYHYLMSFPWRVITHVFGSFMTQVIVMRLIDVALFTSGIVLMRKVLKRLKIPDAVTNVAILFFILTPLTSQVAAQINYDNLMIPIVALSMILTLDFVKELGKNRFDWTRVAILLSLGLITGLIKYAVLPITAAIFVYLVWALVKEWRSDKSKLKRLLKRGYTELSLARKLLLVLLVVVSSGLFIERYGVNAVRYGSLTPPCEKVLSMQRCFASPVYKRDYDYAKSRNQAQIDGPLSFTYQWARHMAYNLMFALNGPQSGYYVGRTLPLPELAATILGLSGIILVAFFWRVVFASSGMKLLALTIAVYCVALWALNYSGYVRLGQLTAVQGRYLLPILVFIYAIVGLAINRALRRVPTLRTGLVSIAMLCFLAGGGALTFIMRSDSSWYWQNNTVIRMNENVQKILKPIVPSSDNTPPPR